MMIDERTVRDIYNRLGDRDSRRIFDERLAYYLTGNEEHLFRIVEGIPEAQYLRALLRCGERNYIFGCGRWGKAVAALAPEVVTGFIDNDPKKWGGGNRSYGYSHLSTGEAERRNDGEGFHRCTHAGNGLAE